MFCDVGVFVVGVVCGVCAVCGVVGVIDVILSSVGSMFGYVVCGVFGEHRFRMASTQFSLCCCVTVRFGSEMSVVILLLLWGSDNNPSSYSMVYGWLFLGLIFMIRPVNI